MMSTWLPGAKLAPKAFVCLREYFLMPDNVKWVFLLLIKQLFFISRWWQKFVLPVASRRPGGHRHHRHLATHILDPWPGTFFCCFLASDFLKLPVWGDFNDLPDSRAGLFEQIKKCQHRAMASSYHGSLKLGAGAWFGDFTLNVLVCFTKRYLTDHWKKEKQTR